MLNNLDNIDHLILRIIQQDAKISNIHLAEQIDRSPAATLERVKKLEQKGVITGYFPVLDEKKLGFTTTVSLHITLQNVAPDTLTTFLKAIDALDHVLACHRVLGGPDFVLTVVASDLKAYHDWLSKYIAQLPMVKQLQSLVITDTHKIHTPLPKKP